MSKEKKDESLLLEEQEISVVDDEETSSEYFYVRGSDEEFEEDSGHVVLTQQVGNIIRPLSLVRNTHEERDAAAAAAAAERSTSEIFNAVTGVKTVVRGKTFLTKARLDDAVKAVLRGDMTVGVAYKKFNVPRTTLQRRVASSRLEKIRYNAHSGMPLTRTEMIILRRKQEEDHYKRYYRHEEVVKQNAERIKKDREAYKAEVHDISYNSSIPSTSSANAIDHVYGEGFYDDDGTPIIVTYEGEHVEEEVVTEDILEIDTPVIDTSPLLLEMKDDEDMPIDILDDFPEDFVC